jgi:hypothetical protein
MKHLICTGFDPRTEVFARAEPARPPTGFVGLYGVIHMVRGTCAIRVFSGGI